MFTDFFTNGSGRAWKQDKTYEAIESLEVPPSVSVTLLAGNAQLHDELAGSRGAFKQALRTIQRLQDVGAYVRLAISLTGRSWDQLAPVSRLAQILGCQVSVITEVYSSVNGAIDTSGFVPSLDQISDARDMLLGNEIVELEQRSCSAGLASVTIDHKGEVVGCERNLTRSFGSLLAKDLTEIVLSEDYQSYMRRFYRRPEACDSCPHELRRFCDWCPAVPFNFGLAQEDWVDFHCVGAMKRRLFWSGRDDVVPGSRPAAQKALLHEGDGARRRLLPITPVQRGEGVISTRSGI